MEYVTNEKRDYARVLTQALSPMLDFDRVDYALDGIRQQEYLRISDKIGGVAFLDVTGMTLGEVLKDVCKIVLLDQANIVPESVITDIKKKRRVAELFRR